MQGAMHEEIYLVSRCRLYLYNGSFFWV